MKLKDLFAFQKNTQSVQTAPQNRHPFDAWLGYLPLSAPDSDLYAAIREAVPVVDAALDKIVRLTGGFRVTASDQRCQQELDDFVQNVRVGAGGRGLHQYVSTHLDCMLTYGNAVGEMILTPEGDDIYALYNANLSNVRIKPGSTPFDMELCSSADGMTFQPVKYPDLILFTPLNPPAGEIAGKSLLCSLPFVSSILLKIWNSVGTNFDRVANLRYAVTLKPGSDRFDKANAKAIADNIAAEWSDAMSSQKSGVIKDFIAVGDVDIKVIGADNQMIDTEVPVRQMLEQIIAKLGIPPFMLGLHWSTTERMSTQQADILTSELESYRRLLNNVITRICTLFLRLRGHTATASVEWDDINLQDEVEAANARYLAAQASILENQSERSEQP